MQIRLTEDMILDDIESYQARIKIAQIALDSLPATAPSYKDRKKITVRRKALQDEIGHATKLIVMAKEAMDDLADPFPDSDAESQSYCEHKSA